MPLVTALLFIALQSISAKTPASKPVATTVEKPYRSEAFHFTYPIPAGLHPDSAIAEEAIKEEKDKATGAKKLAFQCVQGPLMAMDTQGTFQMAGIIDLDGPCLGATVTAEQLSAVGNGSLTEAMSRFGTGKLLAPVKYKLGEHDASLILGSVVSEKFGATFYAAISCALFDTHVVCWEFLSLSPEGVSKLAAAPVQFDGHDPQPVVPTDVMAKAK